MQLSVQILLLLACSSQIISNPIPDTADAIRIVNGFEIDIKSIPYQASLRRRVLSGWSHMCGAVIISSRRILTAAHCVESSDPSSIKVVVGTSNRVTGGKSYFVSNIIVHEDYSTITLEHDIALVGTVKNITYSRTVLPIAIAPQNFNLPSGTEALVSGFGTTSYEGSTSNELRAAVVKIVRQEVCARAYLRIANISSGMICANATDPPRDACQGDSGGPLVANQYLIGIVSWGEGCASSTYPGVYTRVSEYNLWITQNMSKL